MSRRQGFMGGLLHEMEVAQRNKLRATAIAVREQARAEREAERAHVAAQRALVANAKGAARTAAEAEKAAKQAHMEEREADAAVLNAELEVHLGQIDMLLLSGLEAGGYIDLESLRVVVEHPEFTSLHEKPIPPEDPIQASAEPVLELPEAPKGIGGLFKKSEHAAAVSVAQQRYAELHTIRQAELSTIPMRQMEQLTKQAAAESERQRLLEADRAIYVAECAQRRLVAEAANTHLDEFIAALLIGEPTALEEYAELVFTKSEYPEGLKPSANCSFDGPSKELRIDLTYSRPEKLPQVKQYRYVKGHDEITEVAHTSKDLRERYSFVISATTLRSLHEIFDADRAGHIHSVALTGGVVHIHEGVGKEVFTPILQVTLSREAYKEIDLSHVTPSETLKYLGAVISKNLFALEPVDAKAGVRSI